jgi:hypothetical protein
MNWPDNVQEILEGDQAIALALLTPARGVVLTPMTNFALQDREAGTVTINSSVGMWRKLERMRRDPQVALAFHTREHGFSDRREFVLMQGSASFSEPSDPAAWMETMGANWERFGGQPRAIGPLWERWLAAYHWRVNVEVAVERAIVWPDLECSGAPAIYGSPLPGQPASQRPPARGTGPRIDHVRAARLAARLPNLLLGWAGADGFPVVAPVAVAGCEARGVALHAPDGLLPAGGRRGGLLAHRFSRHVVGQRQRKHSGWLEVDAASGGARYAPHTQSTYNLPPSRLAYNLAAGFVSRRGLRAARREGFLPR